MTSVSRKLVAPMLRAAVSRPGNTNFPKDEVPFIPFSVLQQIKLLEYQLIYTLDSCRNLSQIKQCHTFIIRKGLHQSSYINAKIIRMISKVNVPMEFYGVAVFSQVSYPNPFLYTALIRGLTFDGLFKESIFVYNSMRRDGIVPVSFTFCALLKACGQEHNVRVGREIHGESIKLGGFDSDLFVGNVLICMYITSGCLGCGRKIFDEMPERDLISWTSLIVAYAKDGDMHSARELFHRMQVKDTVAWTAMVTGFVQNCMPREGLEYFEKMQDAGVEIDEVTLVGVINACAQLGTIKYGNWIRNVAEINGFNPGDNLLVGSALIDMYSKCGSVDDAYNIFRSMNKLNVYSYSSMIVGFAIHGRANSAIELFEEMVRTDVKPNTVTFIGVLAACSHAGLVERGWHMFEMMVKSYGVHPSVDHYNCVVDLLSRTGRLDEAFKLITNMPMNPSAGVWGALLGGCRMYANPDLAEVAARHLFELEPDNIGNYILLAHVYAKSERWKDVLEVRKLIRKKGFRKNSAISWVEGEKGVIHEFYAGSLSHPKSKEIKEALDDVIDRLKLNGYEPSLSSVLYDLGDDVKMQILMHHSEKLAFAYGLISTKSGCAIRIVKNLRICDDCHSFMCGASQITGKEIIVRDNLRFHHFHDGNCSCCNFW